jgi:hypothetical protein
MASLFLSPAIIFHRCCCHLDKFIAGVIVAADNFSPVLLSLR